MANTPGREAERIDTCEPVSEAERDRAMLRARRALVNMTGTSLDETSGIRLVSRALEEPLRRIVSNAGDEPSVILNRVDESSSPSFGYNAASRTYGDLLQMGVIDPAKVTRLALQNAASLASLILTTDCLIANAPKPALTSDGPMNPEGASPLF